LTIKPELRVVVCDDRRVLEASVYRPVANEDNESPQLNRGIIVINSATGVKREFYDLIAQYFAMCGWLAVTWDARGIGSSRAMIGAANDDARMRDWGEQDLESILKWVALTIERDWSRFTVLGHSSGGHLAALSPSLEKVPRLVLIASGTCYWRRYPLHEQPRILFAWWVLVPLMLALKGYWPARFGVGHDLPKGVAEDWRRGSLMPDYLFEDTTVNSGGYARYSGRIFSLAMTDDTGFAPPDAVKHLLSKFQSARVEHKTYAPADVGLQRIGHFGFFRKESYLLWQPVADWIASASR
jgi:predicted alpha/beta hydrolase